MHWECEGKICFILKFYFYIVYVGMKQNINKEEHWKVKQKYPKSKYCMHICLYLSCMYICVPMIVHAGRYKLCRFMTVHCTAGISQTQGKWAYAGLNCEFSHKLLTKCCFFFNHQHYSIVINSYICLYISLKNCISSVLFLPNGNKDIYNRHIYKYIHWKYNISKVYSYV